MTFAQATQIEEPYRCEACQGWGGVRPVDCAHIGRCPCGVLECDECDGTGRVFCDHCFDHPAKHTHRYEFAWQWTTELLCDECMASIESGPGDSKDGEAWWYETHHETDWQADKARRETR